METLSGAVRRFRCTHAMPRPLRSTLALVFLLTCEAAFAAEPVRLLFAGSSSTYWNDLPQEVATVVSGKWPGKLGAPVTAEIVGRSGSDIRVYSEPGFNRYEYGVKPGQTFLEKVAGEKFDVVTLMITARFIMGDGDPTGSAHADAVTKYCAAIREAGGEPAFYEVGWGNDEKNREGLKKLKALGKANAIRLYVPCGTAWHRVYAERPDLKLQHPNDSTHPGDLGHFLNLACFYAVFTGESPEGNLPRSHHVWPHFKKEEKEAQAAELDARLAAFEPTPYQAALPEWMRRNAAALEDVTVEEETALYLEKTAWAVVEGLE